MKKMMLLVGILLLGLSAGCGSRLPFDLDEAYPYYPVKELDIYYNFAYEVGAYHNEVYSVMGFKHPNNDIAMFIYDVLPGQELTGLELVVINKGLKPVTILPEQFVLVSPLNQQFTYDLEVQEQMVNVSKDSKALTGSKVFQPEQTEAVRVYFRVGEKDITQAGWRLGYTVPGTGLFSSAKTMYMWSHIAYKVDDVRRY